MQPVKFCPKCKTPNALTAPSCPQCGHVFRTQFVPPDQTQMGMPSPVQPPFVQQGRNVPWFVWLFSGCCALPVLLIVIVGALGRSMPHTHKEAGPHAKAILEPILALKAVSIPGGRVTNVHNISEVESVLGSPSKIIRSSFNGAPLDYYEYRLDDGTVSVDVSGDGWILNASAKGL